MAAPLVAGLERPAPSPVAAPASAGTASPGAVSFDAAVPGSVAEPRVKAAVN
jgi:hypothetical protein